MRYTINDHLLDDTRIHPTAVRKFRAVLADVRGHGVPIVVVEVYRSLERQLRLYCQGRTDRQLKAAKIPPEVIRDARTLGYTQSRPRVTNLKTPKMHGMGRAMDCAFLVDGRLSWNPPAEWWELYGRAAKARGLIWGGSWRKLVDKPHVEWDGD